MIRYYLDKILSHRATAYIVVGVILFLMLLPLFWMVISSFKSMSEIFQSPPTYFPQTFSLEAYEQAWNKAPLPTYLVNSTIIALVTVAFTLVAGTLTAYGLSQYRFKGSNFVLVLFLFTRVIPPLSLILPFYVIFLKLGLINTRTAVTVYTIYLSYPLMVWLLKGFFDDFPRELIDAAVIDGASRTGALFRIVLPVTLLAIMAVAVMAFMWTWNEFLAPYLFINSDELKPLTVGIYYFVGDEFTYWNRMSAAGVIAVIPSITFFVLAQKYIVKGLTAGAVKS